MKISGSSYTDAFRYSSNSAMESQRKGPADMHDDAMKVSISSRTGAQGNATVSSIMSGVSFYNIRYSELVSVANTLKETGFLAEQDYLDFIGPSPEFSLLSGARNPDWDDPVDYIGRHELILSNLVASAADQTQIDFEKHLLSLFLSFESAKPGPAQAGVYSTNQSF